MIAECMCGTYHMKKGFGANHSHAQFIQLRGIRFIGLGAVMDELTPRERVYDTLEVFRSKTAERLVTVGYLIQKDLPFCKVEAEAVPLNVWLQDYPDYKNLTSASKTIVGLVKVSSKRTIAFSSLSRNILSFYFAAFNRKRSMMNWWIFSPNN